ncbi:MAG: penicillin-binding protein 2 [Nitrospirota bacterium]|nr:penicillin-binding protein 2 [Nitrospirota bacterium]
MIDKKKTITVLAYISMAVFVVFLLRLWQLQILKGSYYRKQSEKNRVRVFKIPAPRGIIFDRNGIPLVKNAPYFIASLIPGLSKKGLNLSGLSKLLDTSVEDLSEKIANRKKHVLEPIRLKEGLSFAQVARIEARRSDFPGLVVETEITRAYPYGSTGAHLIGYLSLPTEAQLRKGLFAGTPRGTFVGQWGVEALYDKRLKGVPGKRFIEVDALGRQLRTLKVVPPQKGEELTLSVDIRTQKTAEEAFKGKAGALMALDPQSGEVLALVSLPSFDPNLFVRGISQKQWNRLQRHPGHPFLNRVFQSQYPPGSIFKIVTAIAALEEGVVDENFSVDCTGEIHVGIWKFSCWKGQGHGKTALRKAIVESCDIYFYEIGRLLGMDRIAKYANALGLGIAPGVKLSAERKGLIPTTSWKLRKKGIPWYLGETFNAAIGQGYVSITPAQAALMIAAIANGGNVYRPELLKDQPGPEPIAKLSLSPKTLRIIRDSLVAVVEDRKGTGGTARSEIVRIAGKTGTAQVIKIPEVVKKKLANKYRDHAWFVAYAPVKNPSIAVSVFVEHGGHGGETAGPIAKATIEAYMKSSGYYVETPAKN